VAAFHNNRYGRGVYLADSPTTALAERPGGTILKVSGNTGTNLDITSRGVIGERMMNYKKNNIILKVMISVLHVMAFMNIYSLFIDKKYVNDFISLLLLLIELIALSNLKDMIKNKYFYIDFGLLCLILFLRLSLLNVFCLFGVENSLGVILIIVSMILHIYILTSQSNNIKQIRTYIGVVSQNDIEKYVFHRTMSLFGKNAEVSDSNIVKQYIWITSSGFVAFVLYLGKYLIDIKNFFTSTYIFGNEVISIYIVLNILFLIINFIKSKVVGCNKVIDLVEAVLFLIGANLFVFAQKGYTRFQILVIAVYLCCPYVVKTRDLILKLEEGNTN